MVPARLWPCRRTTKGILNSRKNINCRLNRLSRPIFTRRKARTQSATIKKRLRKTAYAFLWDRKGNRYLCLDWEKFGWHSGIIGGVENDENYVKAAKREISEETGYKNIKFIKYLGGEVHNHFFAAHK